MTPRIYLIIERADGRGSTAEIAGDPITEPMIDAAEDLLETLTTGERPPPKGLYDLCAAAFGTTRDDAKKRILAACYGKPGEAASVDKEKLRTIIYENADGTVTIRMFHGAVNGGLVGHGSTAKDAMLHLAGQLRAIANRIDEVHQEKP